MRYIILALTTFFMASCTTDLEITTGVETFEEIDFAGIYLGTIDCEGGLGEDNGETWFMTVSKDVNSDSYTINMGDDVLFEGKVENNELIIEEQTLNEEYESDVITLSGRIFQNQDDTFSFEFEHELEDEESNCAMIITKQ